MPRNPRVWTAKGLRYLLLGLPVLLIVVVAVVAWSYHHWLSVPNVTVAHFNGCLEDKQQAKLKTAGGDTTKAMLDMDDVRVCEASSGATFQELVKAPIEDLKWSLEIIGALAAFFVIAQGAGAYFSADAYSRQAEKGIEEIRKQGVASLRTLQNEGRNAVKELRKQTEGEFAKIHEIEKQVRARYPVFRDLERQRSEAQEELNSEIDGLSRSSSGRATEALRWNTKLILYPSMTVELRQRILSLESFASIDLHPGAAGQEEWSENLRRYAIFYQSKFEYERSMNIASFGDLERAEGYLRKAIGLKPGDFTLLNDLGVLCLDVHKLKTGASSARIPYRGEYRKEANKQFRQSLGLDAEQQRAHYNLSVVHSAYPEKKDEDYEAARMELETALSLKNWQHFPPEDAVKALLHYNLGCCQGWLLGAKVQADSRFTAQDEAVQKCLGNLTQAAKLGTRGIEAIGRETVERDFAWGGAGARSGQEGDLVALHEKGDRELKNALERVKQELLAAANS